MDHPTSHPDIGDDTRAAPARGSGYRTPRWVKVFGIVLLVLVLLIVIMHLSGSGHGPDHHLPGMGSAFVGGQVSPVSVVGKVRYQ